MKNKPTHPIHICHINLAKGFRGGERQTLLLIEGLTNKGIKQTLSCHFSWPMPHCLNSKISAPIVKGEG